MSQCVFRDVLEVGVDGQPDIRAGLRHEVQFSGASQFTAFASSDNRLTSNPLELVVELPLNTVGAMDLGRQFSGADANAVGGCPVFYDRDQPVGCGSQNG